MQKTLLLLFAVLLSSNILAQTKKNVLIDLGYYGPYAIQIGGKLGTSFELIAWDSDKSNKVRHSLNIGPQIGYFINPIQKELQKNSFINSEVLYKRQKSNNGLYPTASVGLAYMLGVQSTGGTVNLGTGNIRRTTRTIHYFVPTLNIGFARDPLKRVGYYFKGFYGRRISKQVDGSGYFGLEFGLKIKLKKDHD